MAQDVSAIVSDCDGTICADTAPILVRELGLEPGEFWRSVGHDVEEGWDPPLAWLNRLVTASRSGDIPPLTRELVQRVGASVELYPGVEDFFGRIRERVHDRPDFREAGISVEWYIVSSGIEELLVASPAGMPRRRISASSSNRT